MASSKLKVGIIGVGGIAGTHLPGWEASEHADLVAGSDIDPLHVLLGANEAGIIVPTGDVAAAAAALRKLVADAELRRSMGDQGVLRAAKYAPEAITEQLAGLYGLNA